MNDKPDKTLRRFGLITATCLVIANMIGAGIFTTSGFSLAGIGNRQWVMLAWCIGGLIAICGAISYGKLSRLISESGGEYLYLTRMLHPSIGFIAGWVSMLAGFSAAIAFAALTFETYATELLDLPPWYVTGTIGGGLIVLFGLLHAMQVRAGVWTQNSVIAIKLLLLVGLIGFAAFTDSEKWIGFDAPVPENSFSIYAFASALVWISLSFSGFNCAVYVAGEIRNPKSNVFWSMVIGTSLVTVLYLCLNFIFLYAPSYENVVGQERIATIAAEALGGESLSMLVRIIILVALCSSVSSMIIAGPRVYEQMATDGVFPGFFKGKEKGGVFTLANSVWLQVGLSLLFVTFFQLRELIDYLGFTLSVSAALTVCCLFIARKEKPESSLLSMAAPLLYVVATLSLATISAIEDYKRLHAFGYTIISGLLLYYFFRYACRLKFETKEE